MNKKQLIAMWAGIGIIILMAVFPPFEIVGNGTHVFMRYGMLFEKTLMKVDFSRLLTQWGIIMSITVGLIITLKNKRD